MNEAHDPNRTVDVPSAPADSLDAGLAAGFGRPADGPGSVLEELRSSLGPLRPVLLHEAEGDSAHIVKPSSDAMPPPEETGTRYQLQGEIARGGMGAVLRGRDVDLGRDLAIKVLLEKHANRPEVARRFIEEAQIGGQLQHPGVVPVYDIGRFGDRPFFTMKLVKGQTLQALLAERNVGHVCNVPEEEARCKRAPQDLPRFLAIALQVAQAMAYAHSKGVIHRDLKPANVMVGAFGEVQVMDWGLAKVLAEGGIADEERAGRPHDEEGTLIRTARSTGSAGTFGTQTGAGSLLGTPAYMPPEQANGDVANLDRRADVFGLGAILCEVLTGKPPYVGRSSEEVRRKAANGDLADATARLDACGADAELIALTKTCLAAEAIDRPKDAQAVADGLSAYLNGVQERLQAAQRERAVAVARETEQRKRRKVQLALAAAVLGLMLGGGAFAWWRNEQAQAGRERDARNAEAVAALLGQAKEALVADDAARAAVALEAARKRSADGGAEQEAPRFAGLHADLALVRDLDEVDLFRWTPSDNKFPDPAAVARRTREALARFGADPDAVSVDNAAARVSASVVRERIVSALDRLLLPIRLADVASLPAKEQKAYTLQLRADKAALLRKTEAVRALLRRVDADPYRDAMRDAVCDAILAMAAANKAAAMAAVKKAAAKMAELAGQGPALEQPPGFVAFLGHIQEIPVVRRRHLLATALGRRPGELDLLMTLGHTYPINQEEGANERLRWHQAAVAAFPPMPAAHNSLGIALRDKKDPAAAEAAFRKALALDPNYFAVYCNLGVALADKGQVEEAIACWRKAIALDPNEALTHANLGRALSEKGQVDEAIACLRKAIELDPQCAGAHHGLGKMLYEHGRQEEAIACYQKVIQLDPKNAGAHASLGGALKVKGQTEEAIACCRKAIKLDPKLAMAHNNLGLALEAKDQVDEAIACWRKAIELDPKLAIAHNNLGLALEAKDQVDEAIACIRKAIELDPEKGAFHNNLGQALSEKGEVDEVIVCFRKVIELDPNDAKAHYNLGHALCHGKGQLDEAIACYQKAIAIDAKYAEAHCNLGSVLEAQGRFAESLAAYQRGHELGRKQPGWRYPSARWVRQAKAKAALEVKLPAFLKGEFQPNGSTERLALARVCQVKKLNHAAAQLYLDLFAAEPKLADDLKAVHRYRAACAASLAAAGQGEDAGKLDDKEKARLRKQALDWLRADLALHTKQVESGQAAERTAAQKALRHAQKDTDFDGLRDAAALAKLPAEERAAYERLWVDVAALLQKAQARAKKETKP
jgi:tetratricopeptide (TPR) repeat protein